MPQHAGWREPSESQRNSPVQPVVHQGTGVLENIARWPGAHGQSRVIVCSLPANVRGMPVVPGIRRLVGAGGSGPRVITR